MSSDNRDTDDLSDREHRAQHWAEHRGLLVSADQKAQEDFDKTVLTLSGGALGLSFAFLKDVVGVEEIHAAKLLIASWAVWGASMLCVLTSYFCSHMAIRRMIQQIDEDTFHLQKKGGHWRTVTAGLNISGAALFIIGVVLITFFASTNIAKKEESQGAKLKTPAVTTSQGPTLGPVQAASAASGSRK